MVGLVAITQALEDVDGQSHRRLVDLHGLETPLEGGVLLQVLAVLVNGGGADGLQLAPRQHRLEDGGGGDGTFGRAGTDEGVDLVNEEDDVAPGADLFEHLLEALLEVTAVAAPGDQGAEVERVELLARQRLRHFVGHDALGQALDNGGLAHTGLADQDGVVLRPARQDLHHTFDFFGASDDGIELAVTGELGQVPSELIEDRRARRVLSRTRALIGTHGLLALVARHQLDDLLAHAAQIGPEADQHGGGHALALAHEAEEHVLGTDVAVAELQRLAQRELQHLLGARRERW